MIKSSMKLQFIKEFPFFQKLNPKVLIVDDQISSVLPLIHILVQMGWHYESVDNGVDAIYKMRKENYDLVVMDWMMPLLDGYQTLKRADGILDVDLKNPMSIPVISYSGLNEKQVRPPKTKNFKYWGHWQKPMRPIELVKSLNRLVG